VKQKLVFITGVSRGIGKALAEKFLKEGYFVIGTSTSGKANLKDKNLTVLQLDLRSKESINNCLNNFKKLDKNIDILINNAGIVPDKFETSLKIDKLKETLEVNLIGTIDLTEKLIDFLNDNGRVINISSSAGSLNKDIVEPEYPSYKISKAAINMYTRILSIRLKEKNILVASVHPGWVKTDMGGKEADLEPEEAAKNIYERIISLRETGQFWFKQEKFPW
jgi:NAD(P)-dependent dehydrogenase (short-subunit alcohol dehydrogenase family)